MAFYVGIVQDRNGKVLPFVDVYVYLQGTSDLRTKIQSNVLGEYSIPLDGPLSVPGVPVDLVFSGGGIQSFRREGVILL